MPKENIGWWSFDHNACTMTHTRTNQVVHFLGEVESLTKSKRTPISDRYWRHFAYEDSEVCFPLYVEWQHIRGRVIWRVDYSQTPQKLETSPGEKSIPPFGLWRRVDDCILDALGSWPTNARTGKKPNYIALNGGWFNGSWKENLYRTMTSISRAGQWGIPEDNKPDIAGLDDIPVQWSYVEKGNKLRKEFNIKLWKEKPEKLENDILKIQKKYSYFRSKEGKRFLIPIEGKTTDEAEQYLYIDDDIVTDCIRYFPACPDAIFSSRQNAVSLQFKNGFNIGSSIAFRQKNNNVSSEKYNALDEWILEHLKYPHWITQPLLNSASSAIISDSQIPYVRTDIRLAGLSTSYMIISKSLGVIEEDREPFDVIFIKQRKVSPVFTKPQRTHGCWIYDPETKSLVNDSTEQRVRYIENITEGSQRPWQGQSDFLFEYEDKEVRYQLRLNTEYHEMNQCYGYRWTVDHNKSAQLEPNSHNTCSMHPSYGLWRRVEDCVTDALLCWHALEETGPHNSVLNTRGGWCNGKWETSLLRSFGRGLDFSEVHYETIPKPPSRMSLNSEPDTWNFVGVPEITGSADLDNVIEVVPGIYTLRNRTALSGFQGKMPHLIRSDGKAVIFPAGKGEMPRSSTKWNCYLLYADEDVFLFLDAWKGSAWSTSIASPKGIGLRNESLFDWNEPNGLPRAFFRQPAELDVNEQKSYRSSDIDPAPELAQNMIMTLMDACLQWTGISGQLTGIPSRLEKHLPRFHSARDWEGPEFRNRSSRSIHVEGGYTGGQFNSSLSVNASLEDVG